MEVKIKKLHKDAVVPTYGTEGAACFDLYASESGGDGYVIGTGLSFEVPYGYVMLVYSRSGHGFIHDVRLSNCVGVIDSDYRGELKVKLSKDRTYQDGWFPVNKGDRIAQAMIIPYPRIKLVVSDELSSTDRGENGFGSTGK